MKIFMKTVTVFLVIAVILSAVFFVGRYGWKLSGFRFCHGAGITSVEVGETAVCITGFYPGPFSKGFCGYYALEQDGKLYVGFRFSTVFGFFETGRFAVTIPVKGEIHEVIMKTGMNETVVWNAQTGFLSQTEQYGVYVKLERNDVYSVSMAYDGCSGSVSHADSTVMDSGEYCFMDNDIMMASKDADAPIPFTVTVSGSDGTVLASGTFLFDAGMEKMYLTVTADNIIREDGVPASR